MPSKPCPLASSPISQKLMASTSTPEVLHCTVASAPPKLSDLPTPEICVICLDRISDRATRALPCRHDHFHFPCLGTWLQHQQRCPLCKDEVRAVRYRTETGGSAVFQPPRDEVELPHQPPTSSRRQRQARPNSSAERLAGKNQAGDDPALIFRRYIYTQNLYSLHVGSNRHSGYLPSGSINPELFKRSPQNLTRARTFIRRELKVFDFLDPTSAAFNSASTTDYRNGSVERPSRRATNREYLLQYIVAILQAIPLKGSEGQAETLLVEYLGMRNARLFLHELESWLRSPFERLGEWDERVQYAEVGTRSVRGEG